MTRAQMEKLTPTCSSAAPACPSPCRVPRALNVWCELRMRSQRAATVLGQVGSIWTVTLERQVCTSCSCCQSNCPSRAFIGLCKQMQLLPNVAHHTSAQLARRSPASWSRVSIKPGMGHLRDSEGPAQSPVFSLIGTAVTPYMPRSKCCLRLG